VGDQVRAARPLALCVLLVVGGGAATAMAQQAGQGQAPAAQEKAPAQPAGEAGKPGSARWGDGRALQDPRKEPARGAPYNWRQMGLGVVIMAIMLAFVIWLVRRETRRR
jgi:hypothetical protein